MGDFNVYLLVAQYNIPINIKLIIIIKNLININNPPKIKLKKANDFYNKKRL